MFGIKKIYIELDRKAFESFSIIDIDTVFEIFIIFSGVMKSFLINMESLLIMLFCWYVFLYFKFFNIVLIENLFIVYFLIIFLIIIYIYYLYRINNKHGWLTCEISKCNISRSIHACVIIGFNILINIIIFINILDITLIEFINYNIIIIIIYFYYFYKLVKYRNNINIQTFVNYLVYPYIYIILFFILLFFVWTLDNLSKFKQGYPILFTIMTLLLWIYSKYFVIKIDEAIE